MSGLLYSICCHSDSAPEAAENRWMKLLLLEALFRKTQSFNWNEACSRIYARKSIILVRVLTTILSIKAHICACICVSLYSNIHVSVRNILCVCVCVCVCCCLFVCALRNNLLVTRHIHISSTITRRKDVCLHSCLCLCMYFSILQCDSLTLI